jgi:hypothetical protein
MDHEKISPSIKTQVGKFQLLIWLTKRRNDFEPGRIITSHRVCIQHGSMNKRTQPWENQQLWCNVGELRDLAKAMDKIGQQIGVSQDDRA